MHARSWRHGLAAVVVLVGMRGNIGAAPIRVVANGTLRLHPTLGPDGRTLAVAVDLHDDRGGVPPGTVALEVGESRFVLLPDASGIARASWLAPPGTRRVHVVATLQADESFAPLSAVADVDLESFVLGIDLDVPTVLEFGTRSSIAVHAARSGDAGRARETELALECDGRVVATTVLDPTGNGLFAPDANAFGMPGVRTVRAVFERAGETVASAGHRAIVRARTRLDMNRDGHAGVVLSGTLVSDAGPMPNAPVRIMADDHPAGAALTDDHGNYSVVVAPDDVPPDARTLRATYTPSEPWFAPARSAPITLATRPSSRASWGWVALPSALALGFVAASRLRGRRPRTSPGLVTEGTSPGTVVRMVHAGGTAVHLTVNACDAATGRPLAVNSITVEGVHEPSGAVMLAGPRAVSIVVRVAGRPAATASVGPLGPGTHEALVAVHTWRDELLSRFRRRIGAPPGRTPRETGADTTLLALVERGAYGRTEPSDETADDVAPATREGPRSPAGR